MSAKPLNLGCTKDGVRSTSICVHPCKKMFFTADNTDIPRIKADSFALTGYVIDLHIRSPLCTFGARVIEVVNNSFYLYLWCTKIDE
jgi:hypothetical protein